MTECGAAAVQDSTPAAGMENLAIEVLTKPGLSARSQSLVDCFEAIAQKYAPVLKQKLDAAGEGKAMRLTGDQMITMIRQHMAQDQASHELLKTVFPYGRDSAACREALTALMIAIVKEMNKLGGESARYAGAVQAVTEREFCRAMDGRIDGHSRTVTKEINLLVSTSPESFDGYDNQTSKIAPLESTLSTKEYVRSHENSIFRTWDIVISLPAARQ